MVGSELESEDRKQWVAVGQDKIAAPHETSASVNKEGQQPIFGSALGIRSLEPNTASPLALTPTPNAWPVSASTVAKHFEQESTQPKEPLSLKTTTPEGDAAISVATALPAVTAGLEALPQPAKIVTPSQLWSDFLNEARRSISSYVWDTWLRPLQCASYDGQTLTLEVCDEFSRDWLKDHYLGFMLEILCQQLERDVQITWVINPKLREHLNNAVANENQDADQSELTSLAGTPSPQRQPAPKPYTVDPAISRARPLNKRYGFEAFVCGPSNELAMAASRAVADRPGTAYNPLFLYGRVGLGKTHLLCAIGHEVKRRNPNAEIVYLSAEDFTQEVVNAVLSNKLDLFRRRYRHACDVLLIDDIQLIAGRERTQHEFFHIFNALYDSERQIVVASDKLPHEIPDIEERLRNRFQFGLVADIQAPEVETRVAILRRKAREENIELNDDVAFFLAEHIHNNVRELEGALVRVVAHASLTRSSITLDYAQHVLGSVLVSSPKALSVEHIQQTVSDYFQIKLEDMKSKRRLKALVKPRQIAMYLSRKHTDASYPDLSRRFAKKDHTTIMSACNKIKKALKIDLGLRQDVQRLEQKLGILR